jgi:hypothetical protein
LDREAFPVEEGCSQGFGYNLGLEGTSDRSNYTWTLKVPIYMSQWKLSKVMISSRATVGFVLILFLLDFVP